MKNTLIGKSRRAHVVGAVLAAMAVQYSGAALAWENLDQRALWVLCCYQ